MPEERHRHAHLLARRAVGGVRGARAHMLADHLGRHEQRRVALDVRAFDRVYAVRRPDAVGEREDREVDAAAAGRAAFDLQTGMRGFEVMEDAVDGECLPVHGRAAGARRHRLGHVFVVVPLDVVDAEFGDQYVHAAVHIVVGLRVRQVDDLLVASLHRQAVGRGAQHPVGVLAVHGRVGVHHLGLEPQAEFHAFGVHVVGKRLERVVSIRPHVLRDPPVAQTPGVVTPAAEPAIVHDEALHAACGGLVGKRLQRAEIMLEIHGLPRVEDHGARFFGHAEFGSPPRVGCAQFGVEARGDLVEPFAVRSVQPRRGVALTVVAGATLRAQRHFATGERLRAADQSGCVRQAFRGHQRIAAPGHVHGVDLAVRETEAGAPHVQQERGIEIGAPDEARLLEPTDGEGLALRRAFAQVVAGRRQDLGHVRGHGEREFHSADFQLAGTHVDDRHALAHEAAFAQFAPPQDAHALLGVARVDRHAVIVDAHVGHSETAEQLHTAGAHHEARRAGPCLGLRGQDARPGRLVERAGDTLRTQRISRRDECARVGERASPMHDARQVVAHNRERERRPCGALLKIHDADLFAAARSPVEIHDCHIPALPVRMRHCTS